MTDIDKSFYDTIHDVDNLNLLIAGKYAITSRIIHDTSNPAGLTSETLLNGYLHLLSADLPQTQSTKLTFRIFDTLLADRLREHPLSEDFPLTGTGPRGQKRKKGKLVKPLWVPEVCASCFIMISLPSCMIISH